MVRSGHVESTDDSNGGFLPGIILYYSVDLMRLTLGNPFNTMKSFYPYSLCSHLNLLTTFPPRADAQKVYREMRSGFSLNNNIQILRADPDQNGEKNTPSSVPRFISV